MSTSNNKKKYMTINWNIILLLSISCFQIYLFMQINDLSMKTDTLINIIKVNEKNVVTDHNINIKANLTIYYWSYISQAHLSLLSEEAKELDALVSKIKYFYPQINIFVNDCKKLNDYKHCISRLTFLICDNDYCETFNEIKSILQYVDINYEKK